MKEEADVVVGGTHFPGCRQTEAEEDEVDVDDIGHKFQDVNVEGFGAR